jgi:hypothetical protein
LPGAGGSIAQIRLEHLLKQFGPTVTAVAGINLEIMDGELMIVVGPSGRGKTTTLNMIAGLEEPTSGSILIDDVVVNDLELGERGLGMVFQNLALFPLMTVFENIAFGLRVKKLPTAEIRDRVTRAAETFKIAHILAKRPGQCSGGKLYLFLLDGDHLILVLRKDILDLPGAKDAFKAKYGSEAGCPETVEQWEQLAESFHTKKGGMRFDRRPSSRIDTGRWAIARSTSRTGTSQCILAVSSSIKT